MIGIIDYGMGNLGSVANALSFLGVPARIVSESGTLNECQALILPGVGAFGDCMANLRSGGFIEPLREWIGGNRPLLGICLGLQVFCAASEESPDAAGLGVLPGTVVRFAPTADRKVPQIGWNRVVQPPGKTCPLFRGIPDGTYFYFVHSYYLPGAGEWDAGRTDYGGEYTSAVWRGNVAAVQFHPEKSQQAGLRMLKNFAEWSLEASHG